jgi:hypothetical protein
VHVLGVAAVQDHDLDAFACDYGIEAARAIGVAVADQEADTRWLLLEPPGD